ncbi:MAG: hypothetical protein ACI9OD_005184 [Limisphaerales bacterium]
MDTVRKSPDVKAFAIARIRAIFRPIMNRPSVFTFLATLIAFAAAAHLAPQAMAADKGKVIHLLNGKDLSNFYTYIRNSSDRKVAPDLNKDPDQVYTYKNGILRVSGQHMAYLATKKGYGNYRLIAEFKWGKKTWDGKGRGRDAGLFFNATGEDKLFMKSQECQMLEGGTGDLCLISGADLTARGTSGVKRFDRPGKGEWENRLGFRGEDEIEKPLGEWNTVEIINRNGHVKLSVNGRVMVDGKKADPQSGKILIQSNNAELFYRRIDLHPLGK